MGIGAPHGVDPNGVYVPQVAQANQFAAPSS